jgi:hypothetical protein
MTHPKDLTLTIKAADALRKGDHVYVADRFVLITTAFTDRGGITRIQYETTERGWSAEWHMHDLVLAAETPTDG